VVLERELSLPDEAVTLPPWVVAADEATDSLTNHQLALFAREHADAKPDRPVRDIVLRPRLPRIVLTGGPCFGKTEAMRALRAAYGDRLHCVPEVASIVITMVGRPPPASDHADTAVFQRAIAETHRQFEAAAELQARADGKLATVMEDVSEFLRQLP